MEILLGVVCALGLFVPLVLVVLPSQRRRMSARAPRGR